LEVFFVEIHAPLPSLPLGEEILSEGADSLFTGLAGFSRESVPGSPTEKDLITWGKGNPTHPPRIHVAINCVPSPGETIRIIRSVEALAEAGYSHFIVNDHGLLRSLSKSFPSITLTASVGLYGTNAYDSIFLEELGAKRIVLPTFSSPKDVEEVKHLSSLIVEVFALCRSEPIAQGKCMLTGYLLAKEPSDGPPASFSAKKQGRCFSVCKGLFAKSPHHDITGNMTPWVSAGTDIFKIEGRYRSVKEIGEMVRRVRKAVDMATS